MGNSFSRRHNVRVVGRGARTVVLGHGFGSDQTVWNGILPWLSARFRVVLYDLACAGSVASDVFDLRRHRSLDGYAEDLSAILAELDIENCLYVGHSVSGMLGLLTAQSAPYRFERLIMIAPSARYLDDDAYKGGFQPDGLQQIYEGIRNNYREWARTFAPYVIRQLPDSRSAQEFHAGLLAIRPDIALWAAKAIFESDLRDKLADCRHPVVILQTRDDPAVPMAAAEYLLRYLPAASLEIIEASGHLPHLTAPELVISALERHLG